MIFSRTIVLYVQFVLLIISIVRFFIEQNSALSKQSLCITIYTCFLSFFLLIAKKDKYNLFNKNYLLIYFIFSIGFIIVHFFDYWSYTLGFKDAPVSLGFYSSGIVCSASIFSLICYLCFSIGYLLNNDSIQFKYRKAVYNEKFLEISCFISLILFYLVTDKRYFQTGGNYEIINGGGLSLVSSLSQFFVLSSIVACGISKIYRFERVSILDYLKSFNIIYYLSVVFYSILVIMSGDRGPLIYIMFGYTSPYFIINKRKFNLKLLVTSLVIGALFMTFLGILRNLEGEISEQKIMLTNSQLNEKLEGEGSWLFMPTMALSNVVRSYNVVYEYTNDYGTIKGLGYLDNVLGFIPGLRTHIIYPLLGVNDNNNVLSSYLATNLLDSDHGMGTTPVGDTFLNFGYIGTVLVFLLFGYLVRKMDLILYSPTKSVFLYSLSFWFLVYSIYIGRATFFAPVTLSIYTWFVLKICTLANSHGKK